MASYVIETTRGGAPNTAEVFARSAGLRLRGVEKGTLVALHDTVGVVAMMEDAQSRFPIVHSNLPAETVDGIVRDAVLSSPGLDHAWLPDPFRKAPPTPHEVCHFGRIASPSTSFSAHWEFVRHLVDRYRRLTEDVEGKLRHSAADGGLGRCVVFLAFENELELSTLHRWAAQTFGNKRDVFRLTGEPMWSGSGRLHVYGVDRHLWQPVSIELTQNHLLAVLPQGTCGNTVNRLVTNAQRHLSPSVRAWIGDTPYEDLLSTREALV